MVLEVRRLLEFLGAQATSETGGRSVSAQALGAGPNCGRYNSVDGGVGLGGRLFCCGDPAISNCYPGVVRHPRQQDVGLRELNRKLTLGGCRRMRGLRSRKLKGGSVADRGTADRSGGRPGWCLAGGIQTRRAAVDSQVGVPGRAGSRVATRALRGRERGRLGGGSGGSSFKLSRDTWVVVQAGDDGGSS